MSAKTLVLFFSSTYFRTWRHCYNANTPFLIHTEKTHEQTSFNKMYTYACARIYIKLHETRILGLQSISRDAADNVSHHAGWINIGTNNIFFCVIIPPTWPPWRYMQTSIQYRNLNIHKQTLASNCVHNNEIRRQ